MAIARKIKDRKDEGKALGGLGNAYHYLRNYAKAIEYHQQSLLIAREVKDRNSEGRALSGLGNAYHSLGNYAKAIEYHQQSLVIAQKNKDKHSEGQALGNLGNAYSALGDYAKAIQSYRQRLEIAQKIKNLPGESAALGNLGFLYISLGNYPKAIEFLQQSLAINRAIKDRRGEGGNLGNLGVAYYYLGDYTKATVYSQQALAIVKEIKDREGEGVSLGVLGNAYRNLGNYSKAIEFLQLGLAISREIKDSRSESAVLETLGTVYRDLHNYPKAIFFYQKSLKISRKIGDRQSEGTALSNLGGAIAFTGNLVAAEKTLTDAIKVWESLRTSLGNDDNNKISIFEQQTITYRLLQHVLLVREKPAAALEIAERGRARALVELLARRLSPNSAVQTTIQPPNFRQIQQIAKDQNATLVQYSVLPTAKSSVVVIWIIKPNGELEIGGKPLDQPLEDLVIGIRDSIGVRNRATLIAKVPEEARRQAAKLQTQRLQKLHQLLIDPIADSLPSDPSQRVIFIPQGSLFLVPFPALQDTNGKYLIEKHTILTAPSIQVLDQTHQLQQQRQRNPAAETLVVGNPLMPIVIPYPGEPPQQLNALPGAEAEANAIAPLLKTQALTGTQGTKATIKQKMSNARIIHLATHGLLDDLRGLGSAIALAPDHPGTPNDGLLTAEEILDLKLSADLVVLSACDTGRGRITGDGVIGLSRSFISAGVPSIIVSLWAVPDAPTAELMTAFYTNWQVTKLDKAQALRQAMLTTMKTHPNPRDWAAFTLIGEAE